MKLTAPQLRVLQRLVDEGPFQPKGAQWQAFYSLERAKLAFKRDMLIYPTEAGRIEAANKGRIN